MDRGAVLGKWKMGGITPHGKMTESFLKGERIWKVNGCTLDKEKERGREGWLYSKQVQKNAKQNNEGFRFPRQCWMGKKRKGIVKAVKDEVREKRKA